MATTKVIRDKAVFLSGVTNLSGSACKNFVSTTLTSTIRDSLSSKTGSPVMDYKRRIALGQNATSVFTGFKRVNRLTPTHAFRYVKTQPNSPTDVSLSLVDWWGVGFPDTNVLVPTSFPLSLARAEQKAATSFYKKLSETQRLFQGGQFLAELRETLHMIRRPASTLRHRLDSYLGALRERTRRLDRYTKKKVLADTWLEYSFGWSPLLSDLDDARTYLDRRKAQLYQELIRISGVGEDLNGLSYTTTNVNVGSVQLRFIVETRSSCKAIYAGAVRSNASSQALLSSSSLGLSSSNFLPTLWEVLPWSFAIDYFTNIGKVIDAWSLQSVSLAWGRFTTVELVERKHAGLYVNPIPSSYAVLGDHLSGGSPYQSASRVNRVPLYTVPVPALQFRMPGFSTKWLNLAALAASRRRLTPL